jgi:hypothetical protein
MNLIGFFKAFTVAILNFKRCFFFRVLSSYELKCLAERILTFCFIVSDYHAVVFEIFYNKMHDHKNLRLKSLSLFFDRYPGELLNSSNNRRLSTLP